MPPDKKENQAEDVHEKKKADNAELIEKNTPPPQSFKTDNLLNFAIAEELSKEKIKEKEKQEKES